MKHEGGNSKQGWDRPEYIFKIASYPDAIKSQNVFKALVHKRGFLQKGHITRLSEAALLIGLSGLFYSSD